MWNARTGQQLGLWSCGGGGGSAGVSGGVSHLLADTGQCFAASKGGAVHVFSFAALGAQPPQGQGAPGAGPGAVATAVVAGAPEPPFEHEPTW